MPEFTLITEPNGKPTTVVEIAALKFKAIKQIRAVSKKQRLKNAHGMIERLRPMAVLAGEVVAMDKTELISTVRKHYDEYGPFLMMLAEARQTVAAVREIIGAAEARLAVALANVEGDDAD